MKYIIIRRNRVDDVVEIKRKIPHHSKEVKCFDQLYLVGFWLGKTWWTMSLTVTSLTWEANQTLFIV